MECCNNHCFTASGAESGSGPLPGIGLWGSCLPAESNSGCLCLLWEPDPSKPGLQLCVSIPFLVHKDCYLVCGHYFWCLKIILPVISPCLAWKRGFSKQPFTVPVSPQMILIVFKYQILMSSQVFANTAIKNNMIQDLNQGLSIWVSLILFCQKILC